VAESGGQPGNQNAKQAKRWQQAIFRALSRATGDGIDAGLDRAADKLVALAFRGDKWALDHLADRTEGRAAIGVTVSGDSENPIQTRHVVELVDGDNSASPEAKAPI
jgi:hypothetical protein